MFGRMLGKELSKIGDEGVKHKLLDAVYDGIDEAESLKSVTEAQPNESYVIQLLHSDGSVQIIPSEQ